MPRIEHSCTPYFNSDPRQCSKSPKKWLGAGWLGGPDRKFRWVLGGWVAQAQNLPGCWETGWPRLKISLGAGGLGGPDLKFHWVLGGWVAQDKNFAGCWVTGCTHPAPRSTQGTQLGGFFEKSGILRPK
jgi:hypothetical protein